MKEQTNNEIDLLLRRLSRRKGADLRTDHLDADELSSYAENVLPAAARTRYTEHLAECSKCRELVVQLSSSVAVVAAEETSKLSESSGLRKFLASLISPMVLRYAVPALGVIVVAVIGFVVLRSNRPDTFVARLEKDAQNTPTAAKNEQPETSAPGLVSQPQQKPRSAAAPPETGASRSKETLPPPPNAPPSVSVTVDTTTKAPSAKSEQQPVANEAPAQPTPRPTDSISEIRTLEAEARKPEPQARTTPAREAVRQRSDEEAKAEDKRSEDAAAARSESSKRKAMSRAPQVGGIATLQRDREDKDKDDVETRSVAGRRFRKQRGIWVDTAYNPDSATVNLARGSEQYRALIADEPAIKTIADQLDGQIIVVWKGRAYRIR